MLNKSDISELLKRFKNGCSIRRIAGVYVNTNKDKVCEFNQRFLAMEEGLFNKYLYILKDVHSRKINDNMISIPFEEYATEERALLQAVLESRLENPEILNALYDRIIEKYDCVGNYLILLWNDAYDVPRVGKDKVEQDESEDVYEHIICAICRVELTAAGLRYNEKNNVFDVRERDWIVERPACGFIYPAFEERMADEEKVMFYTASAKVPQHDFMEQGLGLKKVRTITEIRKAFERTVIRGVEGTDSADRLMPHICDQIYCRVLENEEIVLNSDDIEKVCIQAGLGEVMAQQVRKAYKNEFYPEYPKAAYLLNEAMIKKIDVMRKKREWQQACKEAAEALFNANPKEKELISRLQTLADSK